MIMGQERSPLGRQLDAQVDRAEDSCTRKREAYSSTLPSLIVLLHLYLDCKISGSISKFIKIPSSPLGWSLLCRSEILGTVAIRYVIGRAPSFHIWIQYPTEIGRKRQISDDPGLT